MTSIMINAHLVTLFLMFHSLHSLALQFQRCLWHPGPLCRLTEITITSSNVSVYTLNFMQMQQQRLVYPDKDSNTHDNECKLKQEAVICPPRSQARWCPWRPSKPVFNGLCERRRFCKCPSSYSYSFQNENCKGPSIQHVWCGGTGTSTSNTNNIFQSDLHLIRRREIPKKCSWGEWTSVSSSMCNWHNASVLKQRSQICEGDSQPIQVEYRYREIDHFSQGSDPTKDQPKPHRSPSDPCKEESCPPLHGQWCYWTVDDSCEFLCRHAKKNTTHPIYLTKNRQCYCPPPQNGGSYCVGNVTETEVCDCVNSLVSSLVTFMSTTEGVLVTLGVVLVMVILCTCCISRVFCNDDDGSEDFKIPDYPNPMLQLTPTQPPEPPRESELLVSLNDIDTYPVTTLLPKIMPNEFQSAMVPPPLPPKRYKMRKMAQQTPSNCSGSTNSSTCT